MKPYSTPSAEIHPSNITTMTAKHDNQWRRYSTRHGEIVISRTDRSQVFLRPSFAYHSPVALTRGNAAYGLRIWRRRGQQN